MTMNRLLVTSLLTLSLAACDDGGGGDTGGTTGGSSSSSATASASDSASATASASASASASGTSTTTSDTTTSESGSSSGESGDSGDSSSGSGEDTGSSSGEGSSSTGTSKGMADLDMNDPQVISDTEASIYIQTLNVSKDSCAFQDGCLGGTGERRVLRFDTITPNLGTADFYAGNEEVNPDLFEFSECQNQYVLADYAQYRLLDGEGAVVATGHKAAFALIDLAPWTKDAGPSQYGFNDMGISVGWADIYNAGLSCQWVDITDVPPGDYVLELNINPEQVIEEATFDNNVLHIDVTVTDEATGWTCDPGWFGTGDGCDCGCGELDPDCDGDMTADACEFCLEGSCSAASCADIDPDDNSVCI